MFPGPEELSLDVDEEDVGCDPVKESLMPVKADDSADSSEELIVPFETSA